MPVHKKVNRQYFTVFSSHTYLILKLVFIAVLLYAFSRYKWVIIIFAFELIDFLKNMAKQAVPYLPLDLTFIFGITAAYFYSPLVSIVIVALGILNRILMIQIEPRHVTKCLRHFLFFFAIPFFRSLDFFTVAMSCLILNYILKFVFNIARAKIVDLETLHFNIVNIIGSTVVFYLFSIVYFYFPFLY